MTKDCPCQNSNPKCLHDWNYNHLPEVEWQFIMVIDNNDSRTFRAVEFMIENANEKSSRQLSLWQRDGGQPDEYQNEQQQSANYSSDNAEVARCLTPFSHPAKYLTFRETESRTVMSSIT